MAHQKLIEQVNLFMSQVVQLQQSANQIDATDTIDLLTLPLKQQLTHQHNDEAANILNIMFTLIEQIDPSKKSLIQHYKNPIKELSSIQSQLYPQLIESVCDKLLEDADKCLDELQGIQQPQIVTRDPQERKLITNNNILKPQHAWINLVDNSYGVFVPTLKTKPNQIEPLYPQIIEAQMNFRNQQKQLTFGDHKQQKKQVDLPHPYLPELTQFITQIAEMNFESKTAQMYGSMETTPFTFVNTEQQLAILIEDLNKVSEIAIDLEHHNHRSYLGITCLMQISTRNSDYVLDTLALRPQLHKLLPVFSNPAIIKVLHGADMDVLWLQRDFGLYMVNMFDTGQAARQLQLQSFGLAHLLQLYCNVNADKKYQLADWRIRPLEEEMLKYAREDTHYLLYIYDTMRNQLIEKGLTQNLNRNVHVATVIKRSAEICLSVYQKPQTKDTNYFLIIGRNKTLNTQNQIGTLKALLKWRDYIARVDDESQSYMLPNHIMFQIAKDLPTTMNEMKDCCRAQNPPAIVKYQDQVMQLIAHQLTKKPKEPKTSKHLNMKFDQPLNPERKAAITAECSGELLTLDKSLKKNQIKIKVVAGEKASTGNLFSNQKLKKVTNLPQTLDTSDFGALFTSLSGFKLKIEKKSAAK